MGEVYKQKNYVTNKFLTTCKKLPSKKPGTEATPLLWLDCIFILFDFYILNRMSYYITSCCILGTFPT